MRREFNTVFWVAVLAFSRPNACSGGVWHCVIVCSCKQGPDSLLWEVEDHQSIGEKTLCWFLLKNQRVGLEHAEFGLHPFHNILHSSVPNCCYKGGEDKTYVFLWRGSACHYWGTHRNKAFSSKVNEDYGIEHPCDKDPVWIQDILHPSWNNRNTPESWSDSAYKRRATEAASGNNYWRT